MMITCIVLISLLLVIVRAKYSRKSDVISIWKSTYLAGKPMLQQSALNTIEKIVGDRPIYVVTIVGDYHSGKSSLNNALIGDYKGKDVFKVASDIPPETQGFEVVVMVDDDDSDSPAIVLVDTPGTSAVDFGVDEQASYFGASYLMSSAVVYTTLRRVGSRSDIDFLADRLRFVLSTNATIPKEYHLPYGTSEPSLIWLIQNVDLENASTSEQSQINLFISDHKNRRYELSTIFAGGIIPFTLSTPADPSVLRKFSANESLWTNDYRDKLTTLRELLFTPIKNKGKLPRIWKSMKEWRNRLDISFSPAIADILKGLTVDLQRESLNIAQKILIDKAIRLAIEVFHKEADSIPLSNINNIMTKIEVLKREAKQYAINRAVAVPISELEFEFIRQLYGNLEAFGKEAVEIYKERIIQKWIEEVQSSTKEYEYKIKNEFKSVPFNPSSFPVNYLQSKIIDSFISNVGDLSEDLTLNLKYKTELKENIQISREKHLSQNDEAIKKACNVYGTKIEESMEKEIKRLTNHFNDNSEPIAGLESECSYALQSKYDDLTSDSSISNDNNIGNNKVWITKHNHWKVYVVNHINNIRTNLGTKVSALQNRRVEKLAKEKSEQLKKEFYNELADGISLPQRPEVVKNFISKAKTTLLNGLDLSMGIFSKYSAVTSIRQKLVILADEEEKLVLENNKKKWTELFNKPAAVARREFGEHHRRCQSLDYNSRITELNCFKIKSIILQLPSFQGYARRILKENIVAAIKEAKNKELKGSRDLKAEVPTELLNEVIDLQLQEIGYQEMFRTQAIFTNFVTVFTLLIAICGIYILCDTLSSIGFIFVPYGAIVSVIITLLLYGALYL